MKTSQCVLEIILSLYSKEGRKLSVNSSSDSECCDIFTTKTSPHVTKDSVENCVVIFLSSIK